MRLFDRLTEKWELWLSSNGAAHVYSEFKPSQYDTDLTMDGTAQAVALATSASKIHVANGGITTEAIRVTFGISASNAEANLNIAGGLATTGYKIVSPADGLGETILGVPALATHYAVANAVNGDIQVVSVTQGI